MFGDSDDDEVEYGDQNEHDEDSHVRLTLGTNSNFNIVTFTEY